MQELFLFLFPFDSGHPFSDILHFLLERMIIVSNLLQLSFSGVRPLLLGGDLLFTPSFWRVRRQENCLFFNATVIVILSQF